MAPPGLGGHSLWLMFIEPDGRVLPQLTQIEDTVRPPTGDEEEVFAGFLGRLGDAPGPGGPARHARPWARSLYAASRAAGVETDVVHLAPDDPLVPLPMDEALAE